MGGEGDRSLSLEKQRKVGAYAWILLEIFVRFMLDV